MTKTNSTKAKSASKAGGTQRKTAQLSAFPGFENFNMENVMNGKHQFEQLAQDASSAGREQMEAFVQSGNVFARGFEDLFKTYISWAQESAEKNSQAIKELMSCKTLNEFTETQSRVARENFDGFMDGVTKISELGVKVSTEAFEPINDQFSKSIKRAGESAAA
jgi:phasin family protein